MREFKSAAVPRPSLDLPSPLPRDIEIGAGQGLHAIHYCQQHPDRQLLAIERTQLKFAKLKSRRDHHPELRGLHILHADAVSVMAHFVPERYLERVFLLYPNPYPKAKQANQRWHNSSFMGFLKTRLKPGAHLQMATNLKWYADEALEQMQELWGFGVTAQRVLTSADLGRTHFERKYLSRGETCYELIFTSLDK